MSLQRCPGLLAHSGIRKMNCNPIVFFAHCGEISCFLVYCRAHQANVVAEASMENLVLRCVFFNFERRSEDLRMRVISSGY